MAVWAVQMTADQLFTEDGSEQEPFIHTESHNRSTSFTYEAVSA